MCMAVTSEAMESRLNLGRSVATPTEFSRCRRRSSTGILLYGVNAMHEEPCRIEKSWKELDNKASRVREEPTKTGMLGHEVDYWKPSRLTLPVCTSHSNPIGNTRYTRLS